MPPSVKNTICIASPVYIYISIDKWDLMKQKMYDDAFSYFLPCAGRISRLKTKVSLKNQQNIDNCWGWVMGTWEVILLFSLLLGMFENFYCKKLKTRHHHPRSYSLSASEKSCCVHSHFSCTLSFSQYFRFLYKHSKALLFFNNNSFVCPTYFSSFPPSHCQMFVST